MQVTDKTELAYFQFSSIYFSYVLYTLTNVSTKICITLYLLTKDTRKTVLLIKASDLEIDLNEEKASKKIKKGKFKGT